MDTNLETGLTANREYKDSVFSLLFSDKKVIIPLSNALLGTNYGPDTNVTVSTLRNTLSKAGINDLSFILDDRLVVLIEHQSTLSENMPYRMLLYIAETYKRLHADENEYRKTRFKLQRPIFIILYNGAEEMPEKMQILRLSDMFTEYCPLDKATGDKAGVGAINLELTVRMYDINKGKNEEMVKRCAELHEYSIFVAMIREYQKTMSFEEAVQKAVVDCIDQNVLKTFLLHHKGEVINMLVSEFNMATALKVERMEGMEAGIKTGREEGAKKKAMEIARRMQELGHDVRTIESATGLTVDEILRL